LVGFNIRKEVCVILDFFLSILKAIWKKESTPTWFPNVSLIPSLKNFCYSFVGRNHQLLLCTNMIRSLYPMLVKCYEYLHPFVRIVFDQNVFFLITIAIEIIFEQTTSTTKPTKELMNMELLIFKRTM
jgi:hypothetical protein